jgi:DNA-directed RNA polymerase subunit RPC12/RpoP
MMDALDGNAIAGQLHDVFGSEMTTATGTCATCGSASIVGELMVYLQAPGTVVRCPVCGNIMMVFVRRREVTCVDLTGLAHMAS